MEYLVIMLVCLAVYVRSLNYGIVVDDIGNREKHKRPSVEKKLKIWHRIRRNLDGQYPVKSIKLDRAITISIHTIVCMLIYKTFNSLPTALLFAVNVSNNQVSLWLNGKRYGISAILCMLAYIYSPAGIFFWFLTPWFQASAASFPAVIALKGPWYFVFIIPLILFVGKGHLLAWARGRIQQNNNLSLTKWTNGKICFMAKTFAFYFIRGIVPFVPSMYISYLRYYGLMEKDTKKGNSFDLVTLVGLLLVISIPIIYFSGYEIGFGLMWWLITIAVYSNYVTITNFFGERYMYLPNIGLMYALCLALNFIHPMAWILVFCVYLTRLMTYMPMYKNIDTFFEHHLYTDPTNDVGWNGAISVVMSRNDSASALQLTERALRHGAVSPRMYINRAALVAAFGYKEEAFKCLNEAKKGCTGFYGDIMLPKIDKLRKEIEEKKDG